ncbi:hypothetical protein [Hymenobacter sp. PAMC 26628]|uniref:hypothetical protein n=1 Tax=Hymenobacter sp. PAMC 26628 TaxID=1484118 RepID=UPI00077005C4|nr:hypothetical protein [Hymenobacter sp. PAMC 26628]AMJ64511.1 hypothetical protein AXW84_03015 [Hymenobacter sp. PAMC 26628]
MADQNQDLPLVVSEILIEMHDMKASINRLAEIMLRQQQETNKRFELLMEENRRNTEMMIGAFREEGLQSRQQFAAFDKRLERIEQKLA